MDFISYPTRTADTMDAHELKQQRRKAKKLKIILKKLTPTTTNVTELIAELTILKAKMRYLERADYSAFESIQKFWNKDCLSDSDAEESDDGYDD